MSISADITKVGFQDTVYYKTVAKFGSKVLFPSVAIVDEKTMTSLSELTGTEQFIEYINTEIDTNKYSSSLKIMSPSDVWKFSTFITYISDAKDISVFNESVNSSSAPTAIGTSIPSLLNADTNITQSATFTLACFSGDCGDWARLYAALVTMTCPQADLKNLQIYSVYFTPTNNTEGHVTNLYTLDGVTWHSMDFYDEMTWQGSPWEVAHIWTDLHAYPYGWTDYVVTISQNVFINPEDEPTNITTYTPPIASAHIEYLVANNYVTTTAMPIYNHINDSGWQPFQSFADNLFQILPPETSEVTTQSAVVSNTTYLEFAIGAFAIFILLSIL